jgi:hypothetical protein
VKGVGKSPGAAALSCIELAGPVQFVGWDDDGEPVMRPHPSPDVRLSALSQDQASDATMSLAIAMLDNPSARALIPGLDPGLTRARTRRGKLTPSTARAPSKEGPRPTAVVLDETHLWVASNGGHRLAETLRRGVAKTGGRSIETSNMWEIGLDSVAERTAGYADAVRAGTHAGDGVLTWHPVGRCDDMSDPVLLRAALAELYADAPWVDVDRIRQEILDRGTHPADSRRYYLNQPSSSDDAWIPAAAWASCQDRSKHLEPGDMVTLGFDGSQGVARGVADATALVAVRVPDGYVELLACWQQRENEDGWRAPLELIEAKIREAFGTYRVQALFADPTGYQSMLSDVERQWGRRLKVKASADHASFFWANRQGVMVKSLAAFEEAILGGAMSHSGQFRLSEHVLNARRRPTRGVGIQISKDYPGSPNKIDCAVAATLAWTARLDCLAKGVHGSATPGRGRIIVMSN